MVRPENGENFLWLHDYILFSQWFGYKEGDKVISLYEMMNLKPGCILLRFTGRLGKKSVLVLKANNRITSSTIKASFEDDVSNYDDQITKDLQELLRPQL